MTGKTTSEKAIAKNEVARKTGHPGKLTPEVQMVIVKAIEDGNCFKMACLLADVSLDTGLEWIERGKGIHRSRPNTPLYTHFVHDVERAKSVAKERAVSYVRKVVVSRRSKRRNLARIANDVKQT